MSSLLQTEFFNTYNRIINRFGDKERAMKVALEHCFLLFYKKDDGGKFDDDNLNKIWQDYRNRMVTQQSEEWRDNLLNSAAIKYHPIGVPFNVKKKNGTTYKLVAKEATNGCDGCVFRTYKMEQRMGGFAPTPHCKIRDCGKEAVCKSICCPPYEYSGELEGKQNILKWREDGKDVIFTKP